MADDDTTGTGTPNPSAANSSTDYLPDWARVKLSEANNEAANYRIKLREKTDEHTQTLAQVTSLTDEKTEALKRAETAELMLQKYEIALEAGVPGDRLATAIKRIQGSTPDELKADAESYVAEHGFSTTAPATDPSQGRADGTSTSNDPTKVFAGYIKRKFEEDLGHKG